MRATVPGSREAPLAISAVALNDECRRHDGRERGDVAQMQTVRMKLGGVEMEDQERLCAWRSPQFRVSAATGIRHLPLPWPGFGTRSTTAVRGRPCASSTVMNSPVRASRPRGVDESAPKPGLGTRSTVAVSGRPRPCFTGMNWPVPASRPRFEECPRRPMSNLQCYTHAQA